MIVIDSSGWLEYLTDGALAEQYSARMKSHASVLTPTIVVYEVYKHAKRIRGDEGAIDAVAPLKKAPIGPPDEELAMIAADLGIEHKLAMADAIVLATARL